MLLRDKQWLIIDSNAIKENMKENNSMKLQHTFELCILSSPSEGGEEPQALELHIVIKTQPCNSWSAKAFLVYHIVLWFMFISLGCC